MKFREWKMFSLAILGMISGLLLLAPTRAVGQSGFAMDVNPGTVTPVGASSDLYEFGYGAGLTGRLQIAESPFFFGGGLSFASVPTQATAPVTLVDAGLGAGVLFRPGEGNSLGFELGARAGGYLSLYEGESAGNPHAEAFTSVRFRLAPAFQLGIGGSYGYFSNFDASGALAEPFFQSVTTYLSARWTPGAGGSAEVQPNLEIGPPQFQRIFPVFFQFYDKSPLGSVSLVNKERRPIDDVEVSFFVPRYMEAPQVVAQIGSVDREEEFEVQLFALFSESILGVTENTSVQAQVIVSYNLDGRRLTTERADTLQVQNRNQMTWDDDRKAAAFVTAGDPTVQRVSRNVTSLTRSLGNVAVNERLRNAMAIHEALNLYGLEYVIDPDSSYIELSESENALDYLQFPVQTLDFRAGDCDDLSILYSSLFEAIGIPTAFVTIPGHIFMAIDLGMSESEARRTFAKPEDLIFENGSAWLPIETTVTGQDFLRAWDAGAKQYRENAANDAVGFFPVRDAWQTYSPTGFSSQPLDRPLPAEDRIADRYGSTLVSYVQREIAPQVAELEERIARRASPRLLNRLGTLYARFGLYEQAIETFERAHAENPYPAALYNTANIHFVSEDLPRALEYYRRTVELSPDHPQARLGLARTYFELAQYGPATEQYREVELLAPDLAEQFGYIVSESAEAGRASAAAQRNQVIWEDE